MAHVLLTGGRAPATLELARLFGRAGHAVTVADPWRWHVCRVSRHVKRSVRLPSPRRHFPGFSRALLDLVRSAHVDLLVPTCEEVFWVARAAPELRAYTRVLTPDLAVLAELHHKGRFAHLAAHLGLGVPDTHLLTAPEDLLPFIRNAASSVFKPAWSRFGARTLVSPSRETLARVHPSPRDPWVVQDRVHGEELCAWAVMSRGRVRALAVYPSRFRTGRASVHFDAARNERVTAWIERFARATGLTGQVAFDFVDTGSHVVALECNPRLTSGIHLFHDQPEVTRALLDPDAVETVMLARPARPLMVAAGMVLGGHLATREGRRAFRTARDVLSASGDPLPALAQPALLAALALRAARGRRGLLAATTADIEWNGEA
ncbi:ATP-grasp domain-containing protein [Deinococcus pimensis]|uniref:ATP-grasp domain-containing protein n=1 Tax=Deinococcus pimensis TaxID=309888 RepID=UPI000486DB2E|nr:ATP-grasp domain-containing protein [Deinococcus pimensis]